MKFATSIIYPIILLSLVLVSPEYGNAKPEKTESTSTVAATSSEKPTNDALQLAIYNDVSTLSQTISFSSQNGTKSYTIKGLVKEILNDSLIIFLQGGRVKEYHLEEGHDAQELHLSASSAKDGTINGTLIYAFPGLTWETNYGIELSDNYETANLNSWIVIDNKTQSSFKKAKISFVEGASVLASTPKVENDDSSISSHDAKNPIENVHIYDSDDLIDLPAKTIKKVQWFQANNLHVSKEYRINVPTEALNDLDNHILNPVVETWVSMTNTGEDGVAKNLPAGLMTVYHCNARNVREIIGRTHLSHTAQNEIIQFRVPHQKRSDQNQQSQSVVTTRLEQTEFRKLAETVTEGGYRLNIKNNQDAAVTIKVVVDFPFDDWNITRESLPHQQEGRNRVYWNIDIPAKGEIDLKYRLNLTRSNEKS